MQLYKRRIADKVAMVVALSAALVLLVVAVAYVARPQPAEAAGHQLGAPQVTLNPGGGLLANGTDGLRFTVNSSQDYNSEDYNSANEGQDGVVYRGTYQYCCSAGGPMLNIGGTLYGQAGPAYGSDDWSSIQIVSTTGAAVTGTRTNNTGSSGATIRYTVNRGGRAYTIDRTVTYVYPNDFVTDSYSFVIPPGNTEAVKFYVGGDTAPGSSDQGYGIMLTSPVRSIISLNTASQIMFGFREVQGSRAFDGATSQSFYTPYSTVESGGDIGFVEEANTHDAGLMMQWNLGSTPGTYTGKFEQFATQQGTNLTAAFAQTYANPGDPVNLNVSIVNSELDPVAGLGYTVTLPTGLLIDSTASSNCGGTLTAASGTSTIMLSNVSISGASNCVVTVPVAADNPGAYAITAASASGLGGPLTNNIGTTTLNVGVRTLSFATQGGSSANDMAVTQGAVVTLPVTTRAGYTFNGWNTAADGSGTNYAAGANFTMPNNDTTLYARWQPVSYSVIFEEQGGSPVSDISNLTVGNSATLPTAVRAGYTFVGWNSLANGTGTMYDAGDSLTMPANNVTLYAIWAQNYTLSFDTQGADSVASDTTIAGDSVTLPTVPNRDGYTFIEWNTTKDASGTGYEPGDAFTMPATNVTLFAIWDDNDGISLAVENAAPNNGDGNNDGVLDSQQANVVSFVNTVTGKPATLAVESAGNECHLNTVTIMAGDSLTNDSDYTYPLGLFDFTVDCGVNGFSATVKQYFYEPDMNSFVLRKFANDRYQTIDDATFTAQTIGGQPVLVASYVVVDGGVLDTDGTVNGVITDPAGPGVPVAMPGVPNTGIKPVMNVMIMAMIGVVGIALIIVGIVVLRKVRG